jgi:hypothetical protein
LCVLAEQAVVPRIALGRTEGEACVVVEREAGQDLGGAVGALAAADQRRGELDEGVRQDALPAVESLARLRVVEGFPGVEDLFLARRGFHRGVERAVQDEVGLDDRAVVLQRGAVGGDVGEVVGRAAGDEAQDAHTAAEGRRLAPDSGAFEQEGYGARVTEVDDEVDVDGVAAVGPGPEYVQVHLHLPAFLVGQVVQGHHPVRAEVFLDLRLFE